MPKITAPGIASNDRYPTTTDSPPRRSASTAIAACDDTAAIAAIKVNQPMIVPRRVVGKSSVAAALPPTVDAFIASENQQKPAASQIAPCAKPVGGPQ